MAHVQLARSIRVSRNSIRKVHHMVAGISARHLAIWGASLVALSTSSLAHAQLQGTVQQLSFQGPITGGPVNYSIYLPQGYSTSSTRLPVIYHLHGIGGSSGGDQLNSVPRSYESARSAGLIGPAIIVFANGYGDSFWADSANSNKPAETNFVRELIPFIDANYRTLASRGGRVIQGFSMGGFGTEKFAAKFPTLFSVSVSYDGALLPWSTVQTRHAVQAAEIFNNSSAYFDQYSPWFWSTQNGGVLATDTAFRMVVGAIVSDNRAFRDHLLAQGIPVQYVETGLPHQLGPILNAQGASSWAFIQEHLCLLAVGTSPTDTLTCGSRSAGASMSVAAVGSGPFTYQWQWQPAPGAPWVDIVNGLNTDPLGGPNRFNAANARSAVVTVSNPNDGSGTAGSHWDNRCIVSNACGSVASDTATLTVLSNTDPACCPCPADFDATGGTPDAGDIDAFFSAWLAGDFTADADCSGDTPDSGDVDTFFAAWLAGGC
jgi:enterochelin esterase-like enzyme